MSLRGLVNFWSQHIEFTRGTVAGSMYGASWYLALVYLNRGEMDKARALTLNGAFLQECYVSCTHMLCDMSFVSNCTVHDVLTYLVLNCNF